MSLSKEQLSDYQVCHVIGSGSFGTCYKVRHKHTNKFYVWKVIDYGDMSEDKKKLLVSEVNVLSELNSQYIVKYHNRIIDPDITTLYIIMEYCSGSDLASLIKKCKRTEQFLEEKFIWKVLYQLSIALHVCHSTLQQCQVLHRDIKPANVFLDEDNNVKLGDFGLARVLNWDESHSNTIVGTPYYMSPEVIQGGKYNLKSDIWALGCLIYELCMFKPPFHGENIRQLSEQIIDNGFPRIPAHYSDNLHEIVVYMLSKNNQLRPNIETLLQHPLVVKHTNSYRNSSDPVYMKPRNIQKIICEANNATNPLYMKHKDVQRILNENKHSKNAPGVPSTNQNGYNYQNVPQKNVPMKHEDKNTFDKNANQITNTSGTPGVPHEDKIGTECRILGISENPLIAPSTCFANHRNIEQNQTNDLDIKLQNNAAYQNVPNNNNRAVVNVPHSKTGAESSISKNKDRDEVTLTHNTNNKDSDKDRDEVATMAQYHNNDKPVIKLNDTRSKLDDTRSDSYDEIYGTCVDPKTPPLDNKNCRPVDERGPEIPQRMELFEPACYQYNNVTNKNRIQNNTEVSFADKSRERLTKPAENPFKNSSSDIQMKHFELTEKLNQENDEEVDLVQVQMDLIRQIFNSKMHMKDIMQCFSSDENIYMNSKSLMNRHHQDNDKNNNRPDTLQDDGSNEKNSNDDNVSRKNEGVPMENNKVRAYLETAIDDSFGNKNLAVKRVVKLEETVNSTDTANEVKTSTDQSDKDQIMERYQTLEDKMNELLTDQNKNQEIKLNNSNDLKTILKEKLDKLRNHEVYIKQKEKQLETLEKSLNRREKCLVLQERLAQEKIQRAQVYLKQCKESRRSLGLRSATMSELKSRFQIEHSKVSNTTQNMTKINSLIQNIDTETNNVHTKPSRTSFPLQRSKVTLVPQFRRLLPVDNDSSFSADPGDTSILPTMSKIDPDRVKPLKYYRHVHFEDQFSDILKEMNDTGMRNKIHEADNNSHVGNHTGLRTEHKGFNKTGGNNQSVHNIKLNTTRVNRSLQPIRIESNQQAMHTKLSEGLKTLSNKVHSHNYQQKSKEMNLNSHPNTSTVKMNLHQTTVIPHNMSRVRHSSSNNNNNDPLPHNTSTVRLNNNNNLPTAVVAHKSKLSCLTNHQISQGQSLTNIKLRQFVEARTPLSNVFTTNNANNRVISKRHSSPSALVSPGFITSTITNTVQKDEQVSSAKMKHLLPIGQGQSEDAHSQTWQTEITQTSITGMKMKPTLTKGHAQSQNLQTETTQTSITGMKMKPMLPKEHAQAQNLQTETTQTSITGMKMKPLLPIRQGQSGDANSQLKPMLPKGDANSQNWQTKAKVKPLLPTRHAQSQNLKTEITQTNVTGMKKHFVKSKTTQNISNSNIQQCIRRSVRSNKENISKTQKQINDNVGEGKENTPLENQPHDKRFNVSLLQNHERSNVSLLQAHGQFNASLQQHTFNMKQLDQDNIEIIRKQLQPLTLQNHYVKPKFHFKDILKTRYDNLKLSPLTSDGTFPSK